MTTETNCVVDLNVGGLLYTTSIDTLTKVSTLNCLHFLLVDIFIYS